MLNFFRCLIFILVAAFALNANEEKTHVVVAMPFQEGKPLDPHWYTEEYVDYIKGLLPSDQYTVSGYFVSFENMPKFIGDMKALKAEKEKLTILNVCDGGEQWDGYPGITLQREWEKDPICREQIPLSGSTAKFVEESDNKLKLQTNLAKAGIKTLPQTSFNNIMMVLDIDIAERIEKAELNDSWPLFCKLNVGAGAIGIGEASICHNVEEVEIQVKKILKEFPDVDVVVQPYLPGPEYTILVLKDKVYAGVRRDYHNPNNIMLEDYMTGVRDTNEEITYYESPKEVDELAVRAIYAIPGEHHYTRVDLREDGKGNIFVIDINDRPGFGEPSTVKCMLQFHKLTESQLLQDIIRTAGHLY